MGRGGECNHEAARDGVESDNLAESVAFLECLYSAIKNNGRDVARFDDLNTMLGGLFHVSDADFVVSSKVHKRLFLRHAILRKLEAIEADYEASKNFHSSEYKEERFGAGVDRSEIEKVELSKKSLRSYRLAVTDLFVEKAIAYLEEDYDRYVFWGRCLFIIAMSILFIFGICPAIYVYLFRQIPGCEFTFGQIVVAKCNSLEWTTIVSSFISGFTYYGIVVLLSVVCSRLGRAMMDQAERLHEKRHSLRQGRLYIHLNNGEVTVDDIEKAFDWNVSKGNAFANIPTEASAPWGGVLREIARAVPEILRRGKDIAKD